MAQWHGDTEGGKKWHRRKMEQVARWHRMQGGEMAKGARWHREWRKVASAQDGTGDMMAQVAKWQVGKVARWQGFKVA